MKDTCKTRQRALRTLLFPSVFLSTRHVVPSLQSYYAGYIQYHVRHCQLLGTQSSDRASCPLSTVRPYGRTWHVCV